MTHTPDNIESLPRNSVFVFGSNLAGNHAGGAARVAYQKFGAVMGIAEGLVGQSYAFPTLDESYQQLSEDELVRAVVAFRTTAEALPAVTFYLTKVGCGIAGYQESYIKQFFKNLPNNIVVPEGWL